MWAVVTGASSGIGRDIAMELSELGFNIVLIARRKDLLEKIAKDIKTEVKLIDIDLTENSACTKVYEQCKDLPISVIVNNAGFGKHGKFEEINLNEQLSMIDLNIKVLTEMCHLFIPKLKQQKESFILNVASIAGFMAGPNMAVYYATKAYVLSLSEALNEELSDLGVYTSALCPGPVETEFSKVANANKVKAFQGRILSSQFVAKYAIRKMFKKQVVIIPGFKFKVLIGIIFKFTPRFLVRKITSKVMSETR